MSLPPSADPEVIVFFDGICGLCNEFVDFLIVRDTLHRLRYSPLQGKAFADLLTRHPELAHIDSLVVVEKKNHREILHLFSDASLTALAQLPGAWPGVRLIQGIPRAWRNGVYRWIAQNRYRIFGEKSACRLPSPQERERFLD